MVEEHEAKTKALQNAPVEGAPACEPKPLDFYAFKARKRTEFEGKDWPMRAAAHCHLLSLRRRGS